ncbi:response regulator [Acetivibrio cellulolyticus]|uniref:response regulator n=1 Tax=Acetivibrio cellulolyticus TaxID=35830 RepID=UPI0001E2E785|nr:response regulator [Acetivibrio cellulolyticus]
MKKVLLINDSKLQNQIMKDMLSSFDYEVCITDEYNAIVTVHDFRPDLIIANYIMKETTGDQLLSVIKIQYPEIKCVISSSNSIDINEFNRKKINAIIRTPIDKNELKMALESIDPDISKKVDDADNYEVKKYCSKCGRFIDFNLNAENFFCQYCGRPI